MTTTVLYFAWIKEKIGIGEEHIEFPSHAKTVADAIAVLREKSEAHDEALQDATRIRVALDQTHVSFDSPIQGAAEIALFPPVTGG